MGKFIWWVGKAPKNGFLESDVVKDTPPSYGGTIGLKFDSDPSPTHK